MIASRYKNYMISVLMGVALAGCQNTMDRLSQVGKEPPLEKMAIPQEKSEPMTWPVQRMQEANLKEVNSIWSPATRHYFKDHRANSVGRHPDCGGQDTG